MAKKPKTIAQELEVAAVLLQLYVRLKASDCNGFVSCVTCGTTRHYKDGMQGGHFIGRKWLATKLMEENVHPQCKSCNGPKKGNIIQYTLYMIDMYGRDFVDDLEKLKHESRKFYKAEVKEIQKDLRENIRHLESEIVG